MTNALQALDDHIRDYRRRYGLRPEIIMIDGTVQAEADLMLARMVHWHPQTARAQTGDAWQYCGIVVRCASTFLALTRNGPIWSPDPARMAQPAQPGTTFENTFLRWATGYLRGLRVPFPLHPMDPDVALEVPAPFMCSPQCEHRSARPAEPPPPPRYVRSGPEAIAQRVEVSGSLRRRLFMRHGRQEQYSDEHLVASVQIDNERLQAKTAAFWAARQQRPSAQALMADWCAPEYLVMNALPAVLFQ
jgi:hypothetical protein